MAITFGATAISIGSNVAWKTRGDDDTKDYTPVTNANGDTCAESGSQNQKDEITLEGSYCGTQFKTDLTTFLTTMQVTGYAVTAFSATFDAQSETALSLTLHKHTDGESGAVAVTTNGRHTSLPAFNVKKYFPQNGSSVGVPAITTSSDLPGVTVEGDGIKTFSVAVGIDHVDVTGRTGKQLDGTSRNCRVDLTVAGVGTQPTLAATLSVTWVDDGETVNQSLDGDTYSKRGHDYVLRT